MQAAVNPTIRVREPRISKVVERKRSSRPGGFSPPDLSQNRTCGSHIRLFKSLPRSLKQQPLFVRDLPGGCSFCHSSFSEIRRSANQLWDMPCAFQSWHCGAKLPGVERQFSLPASRDATRQQVTVQMPGSLLLPNDHRSYSSPNVSVELAQTREAPSSVQSRKYPNQPRR